VYTVHHSVHNLYVGGETSVPDADNLRAAIEAVEAQRERGLLDQASATAVLATLRAQLEVEIPPEPPAERKQATVLFADMSGFTLLSERTDAEEMRALVNQCFDTLGQVIERHGGHIDKFIGDEIMVLFGAPIAMEDHAARALYAALELHKKFSDFNQEHMTLRANPLMLHTGINSGLVVAGSIGTGTKREYTVIGDPVNVAARLVAQAAPGEVLAGEQTRRLAGDEFDFEELGNVTLEGRTRAQKIYRVLGVRGPATSQPTIPRRAMIGRQKEFGDLQEAVGAVARDKRAHVVAVIGAAGIGKSRMRDELRTWLQHEQANFFLLEGAALPRMTSTPYYIIADLLRNLLGVSQADSSSSIRLQLEALLREVGADNVESAHALAAILAVDYENSELKECSAEERRARIFTALTAFVRRLSQRGPTLLLLNDLHWVDELSLGILEHLFTDLRDAPVLIITFTRPVLDPEAKLRQVEARLTRDEYTRIVLRELDDGSSRKLLLSLAPGLDRWPVAVEAIMQKAQGNPFFIEEIVRSLLDESALVASDGEIRVASRLDQVRVPDTVWGVLAERIDRLTPSEKSTIQSAAIIGRVFWQGAVQELSRADCAGELEMLRDREMVERIGPAPFTEDWEWRFYHSLVQEVAYSSLLHEKRRHGHLSAAKWLERNVGDRLNEYSTLLAHHYNLGEDWQKMADYSELAGDRAASLFAHREAKNWYIQALEALEQVSSSDDVSRRRIHMTLKLADVAFYVPSEDVHDKLVLAQELAKALNEPEETLRVDAALASWLYVAGKNAAAVRLAEQCVLLAGGDLQELLVVPLNIIGRTEFAYGNFTRCIQFLERSRNITQRIRQQHPWAEGPGQLEGFLGLAYALSGEAEKGERLIFEGLALAEANHDLRRIAAGHMYISIFRVAVGKLAGVRYHLQEAIRLAEGTGNSTIAYVCLGYLGEMHALQDELEEAAEHLDRSLTIAAQLDTKAYVPLFLAFRAEVDLRAGRFDSALRWARRAVEVGPRTTEALRLLGWALHFSAPDSRHDAKAAFRASAEFAKNGGALVFYVRTISDYAAYLRIIGEADAAVPLENEATSIIRECGLGTMPIRPPIPSSSRASSR
jgi:class 3 adenylate cyclase/tetratricopeptide (TPR) repeat protein